MTETRATAATNEAIASLRTTTDHHTKEFQEMRTVQQEMRTVQEIHTRTMNEMSQQLNVVLQKLNSFENPGSQGFQSQRNGADGDSIQDGLHFLKEPVKRGLVLQISESFTPVEEVVHIFAEKVASVPAQIAALLKERQSDDTAVSCDDSSSALALAASGSGVHEVYAEGTLCVISFPTPSWLSALKISYDSDPKIKALLQKVQSGPALSKISSTANSIAAFNTMGNTDAVASCIAYWERLSSLLVDAPIWLYLEELTMWFWCQKTSEN
ncbi:hypothetical protein CMV_023641 [Castanea mollissima]|uniref:Uncharacterized protein n=1 Tax=Castanea mollissima TaxID=60419 RepID=A0A8J4QJ66_9ROSI|nr:hypothetical protein CMV_023641 [Castanea mollissima]